MKKITINVMLVLLFSGCVINGFRDVKGADWVEENSSWRRANTKQVNTVYGDGYLCKVSNLSNLLTELGNTGDIYNVQIEDRNPNLSVVGDAFRKCKIKRVNLDLSKCTGLRCVDSYSFYNCVSLMDITIPNTVASIGEYAFSYCSGLTSITIPDTVTSIGDGAYRGCRSLTSITLPNSVTSIGAEVFHSCSGLTSITIPDTVTSIGAEAFHSCSGLTSITIPNSVMSIGGGAFYNCSGLMSISIPFVGLSANATGNEVKFCMMFGESASDVPILLKTVIITDGTSIGEYAFSFCSGLTSVIILDSVTNIDNNAFYGCSRLTSVTIVNSVTSIGNYAFYNCRSLTTLFVKASAPPRFSNYVLYGCSGLTKIYVPAASVEAYKSADGWSEYANYIYAIEE